MKKYFAAALLPLSFSVPDINSRAFDPQIDNPAKLAPLERVENNLDAISHVGSRRLSVLPWSDRAWDHNRALLNERYTDARFAEISGWPARRAYLERNSAEYVLGMPEGRAKELAIASLSPAEKYDLLMGTLRGGLADANRDMLDREMSGRDTFPTWWGICEGSAAASLVSPEPVRIVKVRSAAYGVEIPFFAPDIKALVSVLWSSYNPRVKIPEIGRQCDGSGGAACFDVNPASFHRALYHFVGRGNGHLLLDTDATRVVWNHPVHAFETYFFRMGENPDRAAPDYQSALVQIPAGDRRRRLMAPGTVYVVGVGTRLIYGENVKRHPLEGSVARKETAMELRYTLELDANLNLLGGEWITKKHPDLAWTVPRGTKPDTAGDILLGGATWDGVGAPPANWESAARSSARYMMPLRKVVDGLVLQSR